MLMFLSDQQKNNNNFLVCCRILLINLCVPGMKTAENLRMKVILGSGECLKKIRRNDGVENGGWSGKAV